MQTKKFMSLFGCVATLASLSSFAQAGNLDAVVTEAEPVAALSQLATFAGTTASGAYSITPTWSDALGFAATGALGYTLSDRSAVGVVATAGQRQREVLLNFGLALDAERQIVFSGGQLQEKLEFGTDGAQEWVKQSEFGIAYDASNYAFSMYHVNSQSTDNFVGAKSTGAEMDGSLGLSDVATLNYAAGYQTLSWDDDADDENGLTARLGMDYQATPDMLVNVFADHNVSENQFGLGAQWQVGAGTLNAQYTRIDGNVGSISDDNRVALMLSMPLGGTSRVASGMTTSKSGTVTGRTSTLLADVMTRPEYMPERVIVKKSSVGLCEYTLSGRIDGYAPDTGIIQSASLQIDSLTTEDITRIENLFAYSQLEVNGEVNPTQFAPYLYFNQGSTFFLTFYNSPYPAGAIPLTEDGTYSIGVKMYDANGSCLVSSQSSFNFVSDF